MKELKDEKFRIDLETLAFIKWNPVKELKDSSPRSSLISIRFMWNPVKELKAALRIPNVVVNTLTVEFGEGIES